MELNKSKLINNKANNYNNMIKNKILSALSILLIFATMITSCKKDPVEPIIEKPTITGLEVGHENSKIGHPGADLHIEAEIYAPANIKEVKLEIHGEEGQTWSFIQTYTDGLAGAKNAEFHKHIDIPASAELGEYHLRLTVIDQEGNSATVESEIELQEEASEITAANFEVEYEAADDELHIEADITAAHGIESIMIEIHGPHEDDFNLTGTANGQTTYHLHDHIDLSAFPSGHYHVHLVVKDLDGNEAMFEEHFDK